MNVHDVDIADWLLEASDPRALCEWQRAGVLACAELARLLA